MTKNNTNNSASDMTISNVSITGSTIATVSTNSDLTLLPNGTGKVNIGGEYTLPIADGTANQVLATNGSGVVSFITNSASSGFTSVVTQVFTSSGTYTPTSGMSYCIVQIVGGGGGGGGTPNVSGTAGGGGGGGGYSSKTLSAATVGASQSITIGNGGAGGLPSSAGSTGGTTSFGSIFSADGGLGGQSATLNYVGGNGGASTGGDFNTTGSPGGNAYEVASLQRTPGTGGNSFFGGGAFANGTFANSTGRSANSYGGGGGGAVTSSSQQSGGPGFAGVCIITEFIA